MSAPRLTDAQLDTALRAIAPSSAPAGLRAGIVAQASATRQRAPLPSPLAALVDIDPAARRRALLLAAALLAALALAGTAVVGSFLIDRPKTPLLEQTRVVNPTPGPSQGVTLDPPADVGALVGSAYSRMPDLQPMTINAVDGTGTIRIYVDGSGAVRIERRHGRVGTTPTPTRSCRGPERASSWRGRTGQAGTSRTTRSPRTRASSSTRRLASQGGRWRTPSAVRPPRPPTGRPRRRLPRPGHTSAPSSSPAGRPTTSSAAGAISGSMPRRGSRCGAAARSWTRSSTWFPARPRPSRSRPSSRAAACRSVRDACAGRCPGPR